MPMNATIDIIDIQGKRVDVLFENKSLQGTKCDSNPMEW
jgi:hypothetical protein